MHGPRTLGSLRSKHEILPGGPDYEINSRGVKQKARGYPWYALEGSSCRARWHQPLLGPRSRTLTADPRTLGSLLSKHEIMPGGSKFGTVYRSYKPKAMGLYLVSLRVDTLSHTLAPTAS